MPKNRVTTTFDFKKLSRKLKGILKADLNTIGNRINKAIQDGIDSGTDIRGEKFKSLEPVTEALGGKQPLNRTGNMRKTKKIPATEANLKFIIEMSGKSSRTGKYYGAFHNTGYFNSQDAWFPGAEVKKREWFGIHESMYPGGSEYKKAIVERVLRIRSAWKKFG